MLRYLALGAVSQWVDRMRGPRFPPITPVSTAAAEMAARHKAMTTGVVTNRIFLILAGPFVASKNWRAATEQQLHLCLFPLGRG